MLLSGLPLEELSRKSDKPLGGFIVSSFFRSMCLSSISLNMFIFFVLLDRVDGDTVLIGEG